MVQEVIALKKIFLPVIIGICISIVIYQHQTIRDLKLEIGTGYERQVILAANKTEETLQVLAEEPVLEENLHILYYQMVNESLALSRLPNHAIQNLAEQLHISGEQLYPALYQHTTPEELYAEFERIHMMLTSLQHSFESDPYIWYKEINSTDSQTIEELLKSK